MIADADYLLNKQVERIDEIGRHKIRLNISSLYTKERTSDKYKEYIEMRSDIMMMKG